VNEFFPADQDNDGFKEALQHPSAPCTASFSFIPRFHSLLIEPCLSLAFH
jgi:hypothetical protein